jgi:predicted metal-dependent hydrolase
MGNINNIKDTQLGTILFRKNERAKKYIIRIKPDGITVTIPRRGNFKDAEIFLQSNRNLVIEKQKEVLVKFEEAESKSREGGNEEHSEQALRLEAKVFFPPELKRLAEKHGFKYANLSIRKSKTRWGSCSSKKNINLSFRLVLLPSHLIEYVMLHELCHTVQMNHSPAFWDLLNRCTLGKAKELSKELKNYH